jgi:hypothetical protein
MLVGYEMQWTIRYFYRQAGRWEILGTSGNESSDLLPGRAAYAARKAAMWRWLALKAEKRFLEVHPHLQVDKV